MGQADDLLVEKRLAASLLVLAGGGSRRMGRPKALLQVAGTTLIEFVAAGLEPEFAELLISANDPELVPPGLAARARTVHDLHQGAGPLAGIEAGLAAASQPMVLAVACDMPFVSPALARRLVAACQGHDAAVPILDGRPEPVCAAYASSAAGPIAAALAEGRLRASDVLDDLDIAWLRDVDPEQLRSLNTPEAYRRFLDAML
jgi:molybdopterin-guanine dinucleotide biosynthesis protein A